MTQYNDTSTLSRQIADLRRDMFQLATQPRAISTSIDRGGTQSSDYDGTGIDAPGTTGWKIGTDETTGVGYIHLNGVNSRDLVRPHRSGAPYIAAPLTAPFVNYGTEHHRASYLRTSLGIVCLSGLLNTPSITNSIAFTLPEGYRPDGKIMFPIIVGGSTSRLDIYPNGDVIINATAASYVSISGIMFPAAGVATWTPHTFSANWEDYTVIDSTWAPCGYWRDSEGRVWQRGLARYIPGGTLGTDSSMFTLPFTRIYQSHYPTIASSAFGSTHLAPGSGSVAFFAKSGTAPAWLSLTRLAFVDEAMRTDWVVDDYHVNSWTKFAGGFPPAQYMLFKDGIVFKDGLLAFGTAGAVTQFSIPGLSPDIGWKQNSVSGKELFFANAGNAFCRVDILNQTYTETPRVQHITGGSVWLSYGAINYVIGY